jgi:hypothetical protein
MIRRLVAVLVILLLLILVVTRACGEGSGEPPTPSVSEKPTVTGEDTTNATRETTEQGVTSVSPP